MQGKICEGISLLKRAVLQGNFLAKAGAALQA